MSGGHGRATAFAAGLLQLGPGYMVGFTLTENAGTPAAAQIRLYDNASAASGTILATLKFVASESKFSLPQGDGVYFTAGVFAQVVSGSVEGSVFIG